MYKIQQANHIGFMEDVDWSDEFGHDLLFKTENDAWDEVNAHIEDCEGCKDTPDIQDFDVVEI